MNQDNGASLRDRAGRASPQARSGLGHSATIASASGYVIGKHVPWNAAWSSEEMFEIRPCRWADGKRALWSPHTPGIGRPLFAKPHTVRQRQSVVRMLCTVCGEPTLASDRWWFRLGEMRGSFFMTTEAPVHRACAEHALQVCPHLRGRDDRLEPFPSGYVITAAMVGGAVSERDFGVRFPADGVVGHLKFAWPAQGVSVGGKTFAIMADTAQAIEARRAETQGGSVHESAVPNGDAP